MSGKILLNTFFLYPADGNFCNPCYFSSTLNIELENSTSSSLFPLHWMENVEIKVEQKLFCIVFFFFFWKALNFPYNFKGQMKLFSLSFSVFFACCCIHSIATYFFLHSITLIDDNLKHLAGIASIFGMDSHNRLFVTLLHCTNPQCLKFVLFILCTISNN